MRPATPNSLSKSTFPATTPRGRAKSVDSTVTELKINTDYIYKHYQLSPQKLSQTEGEYTKHLAVIDREVERCRDNYNQLQPPSNNIVENILDSIKNNFFAQYRGTYYLKNDFWQVMQHNQNQQLLYSLQDSLAELLKFCSAYYTDTANLSQQLTPICAIIQLIGSIMPRDHQFINQCRELIIDNLHLTRRLLIVTPEPDFSLVSQFQLNESEIYKNIITYFDGGHLDTEQQIKLQLDYANILCSSYNQYKLFNSYTKDFAIDAFKTIQGILNLNNVPNTTTTKCNAILEQIISGGIQRHPRLIMQILIETRNKLDNQVWLKYSNRVLSLYAENNEEYSIVKYICKKNDEAKDGSVKLNRIPYHTTREYQELAKLVKKAALKGHELPQPNLNGNPIQDGKQRQPKTN